MAYLTTKGWVIKEDVILTGVLADFFEHIIDWLNDESGNKISEPLVGSTAIIKIFVEFEEVFCEAYIQPQNNFDNEIVFLKRNFAFPAYIDELKALIRNNNEISEKLINI